MIAEHIIADAVQHAQEASPAEACGLVVVCKGKARYVRCRNVAPMPARDFLIATDDEDKARELGEVVGVVHSHPHTPPQPSDADLAGIEQTRLPWLIVSPDGRHSITEPSGYKAPLVGREFRHFTADCYTLVRDYFAELDIELPDYPRDPHWWNAGGDLYRENFKHAGFTQVIEAPREHDVLLMHLAGSPVPNHGAIYLGDGYVLQHLEGRLSSRDLYAGHWRRATTAVLRHRRLA